MREENSPLASESTAPFLKWAGGKRWLTAGHYHLFPHFPGRYLEPFLGGGAVFARLRPRAAILGDLNDELIRTYKAIRDNAPDVYERLAEHASRHDDAYYYEVRSSPPHGDIDLAARFIYLNRTCWNGLYRVNKAGLFNVPRGTKNTVLLEQNFSKWGDLLRGHRIISADFSQTIMQAGKGDFIFCDPPYTVKHNLNGFVKYNEKIFSWNDQVRLHECLVAANRKGALIMCTNANHASVRELYGDDFSLMPINRFSGLAASAHDRRRVSELVIMNESLINAQKPM